MESRAPRRLCGATARALAVAAVAAACGSITFPEQPPAIQGDIVGVGPEVPFGSQRAIWVKEAPDAPCGIVFTVTDATEIGEQQPDFSIEARTFADLVVGRTVRVWARVVMDSCPGQARADAVELIPRLEGE